VTTYGIFSANGSRLFHEAAAIADSPREALLAAFGAGDIGTSYSDFEREMRDYHVVDMEAFAEFHTRLVSERKSDPGERVYTSRLIVESAE
jgi:hypothetical protein